MAGFFKKKGGGAPGSSAIQMTDVSVHSAPLGSCMTLVGELNSVQGAMVMVTCHDLL